MKIGRVIAKLRIERGWSLDQLANRVGITKSSLSRMENDGQWPRPETLDALAEAFEAKVYQLFAMAADEPLPTRPPAYSAEEREILNAFRVMEPDARKQYRELARILAEKQKPRD